MGLALLVLRFHRVQQIEGEDAAGLQVRPDRRQHRLQLQRDSLRAPARCAARTPARSASPSCRVRGSSPTSRTRPATVSPAPASRASACARSSGEGSTATTLRPICRELDGQASIGRPEHQDPTGAIPRAPQVVAHLGIGADELQPRATGWADHGAPALVEVSGPDKPHEPGRREHSARPPPCPRTPGTRLAKERVRRSTRPSAAAGKAGPNGREGGGGRHADDATVAVGGPRRRPGGPDVGGVWRRGGTRRAALRRRSHRRSGDGWRGHDPSARLGAGRAAGGPGRGLGDSSCRRTDGRTDAGTDGGVGTVLPTLDGWRFYSDGRGCPRGRARCQRGCIRERVGGGWDRRASSSCAPAPSGSSASGRRTASALLGFCLTAAHRQAASRSRWRS